MRFDDVRSRTLLTGAALGALALGGCVTVFPKTAPVQLYRFGPSQPPAAEAPPAPGAATRGVVLSDVQLPPGAAGDGVLTLSGDQASYIGGARWLEPAAALFQADVQAAFAARPGGVLLLDRGQLSAATAILRIDVSRFETRYPQGAGDPPTVVVRLRATLDPVGGGPVLAREFSAELPAGADRVSGIVAAYDAAVGRVLTQLVDWTETSAPAASPRTAP